MLITQMWSYVFWTIANKDSIKKKPDANKIGVFTQRKSFYKCFFLELENQGTILKL